MGLDKVDTFNLEKKNKKEQKNLEELIKKDRRAKEAEDRINHLEARLETFEREFIKIMLKSSE